MATVKVTRGFTATAGVPITTDEMNLGFLPSVEIEGEVSVPGDSADEFKPGVTFTANATGSAGAYAVTLDPAPDSLVDGLWCGFVANHTNSGAATLNVNGLSSGKAIVTQAGLALTGGEIVDGQPVFVQWNATDGNWRMWSAASKPTILYAEDIGLANAYKIKLPMLDTSTLAQLAGVPIVFKAAAGNTGASTLQILAGPGETDLTAIAITKLGTSVLNSGDIGTGSLVQVVYDGNRFQVSSGMPSDGLPDVIAGGDIVYPYKLTIDNQGRVTYKSPDPGTLTENLFTEEAVLPIEGTVTTFTHGLGRTPAFVRVTVYKSTAGTDQGYTQGDEVDVTVASSAATFTPAFCVSSNSTTIAVVRRGVASLRVLHKTTFGLATLTEADWKLRVRAW